MGKYETSLNHRLDSYCTLYQEHGGNFEVLLDLQDLHASPEHQELSVDPLSLLYVDRNTNNLHQSQIYHLAIRHRN